MKTVYRLLATSDDDFDITYGQSKDTYFEFYFESFDKDRIQRVLAGLSTKTISKSASYEEYFMQSVAALSTWLTGYDVKVLDFFHKKSFGGNAYVELTTLRVPEPQDFVENQ